jgi:hypothetical protein
MLWIHRYLGLPQDSIAVVMPTWYLHAANDETEPAS